jgi:hypothetical protein
VPVAHLAKFAFALRLVQLAAHETPECLLVKAAMTVKTAVKAIFPVVTAFSPSSLHLSALAHKYVELHNKNRKIDPQQPEMRRSDDLVPGWYRCFRMALNNA